jgi:hypothetical protein
MYHKRRLRLAVFLVVGLLSLLLLLVGVTHFQSSTAIQSILLNLGTEFAGIVLIFLLIEKLFGFDSDEPDPELHSSMHQKLDSINSGINEAVRKILSEVSSQQQAFATDLQRQFSTHTADGMAVIRQAVAQDLSNLMVPAAQRDQLLARLLDMIQNAISQMGEFQKLNLQKQTENVVTRIEETLNESMTGVVKEVKSLQKTADRESRTLALPAPGGQRKAKKGSVTQ